MFQQLLSLLAASILLVSCGIQRLPEGVAGDQAEDLTDQMLNALNYQAYQELDTIKWTFAGDNSYVWNKKDNIVTADLGELRVTFSPDTMEGEATDEGQALSGEDLAKAIEKGWENFANDSFWLVAPFKARDPGTTRKLVDMEDGPALLVTFDQGGVTPGDSYMFIFDEDMKPKEWKMWVKIIPVPGLSFSWENWEQHEGVWFSSLRNGPMNLELSNIEVSR